MYLCYTELFEIEQFWHLYCVLMLNWIIWNNTVLILTLCIAQLVGAVEYTNCFSAEGKTPAHESPGYDNLMVRFQWCWDFGECRAPLHWHCSQAHSDPVWQHLIGPYLNRTNGILMQNWIVWIRTVCLNWIAWNRNVFDN